MDKDSAKILKGALLLLYPPAFLYIMGTLYPYRGPPTLDFMKALVSNADAVPLVFIFTMVYPIPLYLYYFCSYLHYLNSKNNLNSKNSRPPNPKFYFFSHLILAAPSLLLCLIITAHTAPSYPSSVLNPLPLTYVVETVLRGFMVPFMSIWYMDAVYLAAIPHNPTLGFLSLLGYAFFILAFMFPISQWYVAGKIVNRILVPLMSMGVIKGYSYPKVTHMYRDVVNADKFRDPAAYRASAGERTAVGAAAVRMDPGTGAPIMEYVEEGVGAGKRAYAPIINERTKSILEKGRNCMPSAFSVRASRTIHRISHLNETPLMEEHLNRAREALRGLYLLLESDGVYLTQEGWRRFLDCLEDAIISALEDEDPFKAARTGQLGGRAPEPRLQPQLLSQFQDRSILVAAYVKFTAPLFEDFKRRGVTRASSPEEFIEERILAARGYLRPGLLLRPENWGKEADAEG